MLQSGEFSISRVWNWWTDQLAAAIPQWIRQICLHYHGVVRLQLTRNKIHVARYKENSPALVSEDTFVKTAVVAASDPLKMILGTFDQTTRVEICLADDVVLLTPLQLPAATAENLAQVLAFEMDLYTPLTASQVYFNYEIIEKEAETIAVNMLSVPKEVVDEQLEEVRNFGLQAERVYCKPANQSFSGPDHFAWINFLPSTLQSIDTEKRTNLFIPFLWLLALMLTTIAVAIPIVQKSELLITLNTQLVHAEKQVRAITGIRKNIDSEMHKITFLIDKKNNRPSTIVILDEISRLLPSNSWLSAYGHSGNEIKINGVSSSASRLVPIIESTPLFYNTRFLSPITKSRQNGKEKFYLSTQIKVGTGELR